MTVNTMRVRSLLALSVAFVVGGFGAGCTPTPEDTCHRLDELSKRDASGFSLSWKKCMARMSEMKDRDPEAYRCTAKTVAKLQSIDTALLAVSVCDKGGPSSRGKKSSADD
jgi:hypothetical protein